jgi:hypothetical protein
MLALVFGSGFKRLRCLRTSRRPCRGRLPTIALGVAAVVAISNSAAGAEAAHESRALPKLVAGSYSGIKPRGIFFSADGGNIVLKIMWKRWTQKTAVGHGTSNIQGCVPDCAQGKETPVATKVVLSRPRAGHFTKIVEVRAGHTLVAHYRGLAWPEGAQR